MPIENPQPQKSRGCFFYGCITCLVALVIIGIVAFIGFRMIVNKANAFIDEYTDTTAMALPKVDMPADEVKKLQARVDEFDKASAAHSNTPPLVLTSRELNSLLANAPGQGAKDFKDRFYVSLEGDAVKGQISLPLEKYFKIPMLHTRGRFVNGVGTFDIGLTNSRLSAIVKSLEVKGKPIPETLMTSLRGQDILANEDANGATNTNFFSHAESLVVTNGTMIIKPRTN